MLKFILLLISLFIFHAAYAAALPIPHEKESPLTPRSNARQWINANKKDKRPSILEVKNIYEGLCYTFKSASGKLELRVMIDCWVLHKQVCAISKITPKENFQTLEVMSLHYTLWRLLQRTKPNNIVDALELWQLHTQIPTIREKLTSIITYDILKIFKAAFDTALNSSNIDEALKLWQQQQKFIIDAHALTENTDHISLLDMHAAFSSILEKEDESYRTIHIYEVWQRVHKEFPLQQPSSFNQFNAFKSKYEAAKLNIQLPSWIDCNSTEPSITTSAQSFPTPTHSSTLEHSWRNSPKNKIAAWVDSLNSTPQHISLHPKQP